MTYYALQQTKILTIYKLVCVSYAEFVFVHGKGKFSSSCISVVPAQCGVDLRQTKGTADNFELLQVTDDDFESRVNHRIGSRDAYCTTDTTALQHNNHTGVTYITDDI